ncbi:porphobilinogen synthase [Synechocystis sp. PCC 6803]|uniref:Delta-aminolevulinic acid dehydratase n=1 Tax=Synechocystis sp. (strain ATCC 27184 / PCC 6803 / Kazusa) TaxID=1111708 RepID=HEM2_SYNY3|nr:MULTISPECIES: porphobilinogen synthase [unclassified Synechocystis]P77969.1 RecName: Full=Delta-aminolevulinic acid dehydratase; Short=ALAD; Short=ALADH; AltName: Full=Porphobilinogen synthase [Synechocystis sp. PCC 6803 substr. Kazusa]BAM51815.1 delta-aminolevulinic acid dehydratase [Synechocystis sp. PCC 6803] [Bacillus subtilis BEST7613]AGF51755.1 porphobilinogen synthase [Synechocystis sp. PCC 6803]ALJ67745.1 delta-aminolevulinic acid dehydratase [Synechocystis sp. PCC 6803]AVP89576.1 p
MFPTIRPRRLRQTDVLRRMVRENTLTVNDLIYPLFAVPGNAIAKEVVSMPGVYQLSVDKIVDEAKEVRDLGIPAIILFGIPEDKDTDATGAWHDCGIVQKATEAVKKAVPDLVVIVDTCLCEYTNHGHCGYLETGDLTGRVLNDPTLELLKKTAVSQANAGADVIAPSGMMDGFVQAIREALDDHDFQNIPILSYAAKYASAYYGPFRDAADSSPQFGDRRTYQMDPGNSREALKEVELDLLEGADMVMVKPALSYMDIIWRIKEMTNLPVAAYNVSGEYSMVKAAALNGWIDEQKVTLETLTSFKRAGADLILTYHAKDAARWLQD